MSATDSPGGRMLSIPACLALFAGALVMAFHAGGSIPFLSPDTINDEKFIRNCCVFYGMGTSVDGIVMGANWWHFKALWAFLGLGDRSLHILLHISLAGAVVLLVLAGARIRNQWVGYLAVAAMMAMLWTGVDFRMDMTYNHRGFPFLGTLILVLCMAAVDTGRARYLAMAGFVAAITTNVHLQAGVQVFSIGLMALMMEGRRARALLVGLGAFAMTAFFTSPAAWIDNLGAIVARLAGSGIGGGLSISRSGSPFSGHFTALAAAIEVMLVMFLATGRKPAMRKVSLLLLAMLAPKFIVFGGSVALGIVENSDKYLIDIEPAIGLAMGFGAVMAMESLWTRWGAFARVGPALPYCAAAAMALLTPPKAAGMDVDGFPMLNADDIEDVYSHLVRDKGWNLSMMAQRLKGPANLEMIEYSSVIHPVGWEAPRPGDDSLVTVVKLHGDRVPDPVPENWQRINDDGETSLWAVWTRTWIDWGRFRVCHGPWGGLPEHDECSRSGIGMQPWASADEVIALNGFPKPSSRLDDRLRITFDVTIPPGALEHRVFMPELSERCSGRMKAVRLGGSEILDDGRSAVLRSKGGAGARGEMTIEWHLGGEECSGWSYSAYVPFFVEGTPEDVAVLEAVLNRYRAPNRYGRYTELKLGGAPMEEAHEED